METTLDWRKDTLCVRVSSEVMDGLKNRSSVTQWFPLYAAAKEEVRTLIGRPLTVTSPTEGLYVDADGNVYQLPEKAATRAIDAEWRTMEREEVGGRDVETPRRRAWRTRAIGPRGNRKRWQSEPNGTARAPAGRSADAIKLKDNLLHENDHFLPPSLIVESLNLRQKLALARRRLGYIQKRGYNEVEHYRYVAAADIAGAVGDILAEIGVIVVPRLDSIAHESASGAGHLTRVIMSYSFMDTDTSEEITVKIAGEAIDPSDKGSYKAMTGALKYALMQSLLLATGDDPEEARLDAIQNSPTVLVSEATISARELRDLRRLLEETNTEAERVLTYYKIGALEEMTPAIYRRAMDVLRRKRSLRQDKGGASHAEN